MPAQGSEANHEIDGLTVINGLALQPSRSSTTKAFLNVQSDGTVTNGSSLVGSQSDVVNGVVTSTNVVRETLPGRHVSLVGGTALTTQVMYSFAIPLVAGDVISQITFRSGNTAAGTPTNWWFALYSSAATPALLAQTADQTTGAWAANTTKTLALATSQTITTTGVYYVAVMMKATTPNNLVGVTALSAGDNGALITSQKVLAQTSGSALTTTAPATIATPTTVIDRAYAICSTVV